MPSEKNLKRAEEILDKSRLEVLAHHGSANQVLQIAIAQALDEAEPQWPSENIIEAEAIARFGNPEMKMNSEDLHWWRYKDSFKQGVQWLRERLGK